MASIIDEIPDEYLKSIGKITISWSYLEWCIDFLIWSLIGVADKSIRGISITAHLTFSVKYDMAMTLAKIYLAETEDKKKYDLIKKLLNEADRLRVKRNKICHSAWYPKDDKIASHAFSARAKLKSDPVNMDITSLNTVKDEILDCYNKIFDLNESIISENVNERKSLLQKLLSLFGRGDQN